MLRFIGHSTSGVVSECSLVGSAEVTVGRDAKCGLLLDSLVSPRMISRVHAKITQVQPATATNGQPGLARWLLTDCKSMNGVFLNDVKVESATLRHNDVITFGGLGQKVAMGATFPQPDAEFIFRFFQPQPADDDATQPMGADLEDPDKTQPPQAATNEEHEEAATAEEAEKEAEESSKEDDEADGQEKEDAESEKQSTAASVSVAEDEVAATLVVDPVDGDADAEEDEVAGPGAAKAEADEFEPTQVLPAESEPTPQPAKKQTSRGRRQASKEAAPPQTIRKTSSDMMEDISPDAEIVAVHHQTVVVTAPTMVAAAAGAPGRTFSSAPTQLLPSEASSGSQMMEISQTPSGLVDVTPVVPLYIAGSVAAVSADPYALRAPAGLSMDASLDMSLVPLPTIDDSSQIHVSATMDAFADGLEHLGMMTQTQVVRADSIALPSRAPSTASAASAAHKLTPLTGSPDELYDDEEDSPTAAAAGAGAGAGAAGGRKSKKRDRASRGEDSSADAPDGEDDDLQSPKKLKVDAGGASPRATVRVARRH